MPLYILALIGGIVVISYITIIISIWWNIPSNSELNNCQRELREKVDNLEYKIKTLERRMARNEIHTNSNSN